MPKLELFDSNFDEFKFDSNDLVRIQLPSCFFVLLSPVLLFLSFPVSSVILL